MRIGVTTFGGDGGKSGISRYIINLLAEFARIGGAHEFEVLLYEDEQEIFLPDPPGFMRPLAFPGSFRRPLRNVLWHQTRLGNVCRKRGYDVLFLPAANRRAPAFCPVPTAGTVHDFSSIHVQGKYDASRMFYIKKVLPFLARRLTRVLTVSESSKQDIVQYARVPAERVTVTPLAADSSVYHPSDPEAARQRICAKYKITPPYVLYTSRLEHPGKNHVALIQAFAEMKKRTGLPHQLVLVGSDWMGAEDVHRVAEESPFASEIIFTGFAATADLPDLYLGADLFVFPSLYEGFGLPVLEAMSCGVPVACSNVSSLPEVAGDAGVLFDPADCASIAAAMEKLLASKEAWTAAREKGLARAAQFNWEATARATLAVIEEAAREGRK